MNLVFFDIECASVNKNSAKICAFGYVVCDENFNIIKKEDILVNPKGRFHLTDRKGDKGIVLPYSYDEFKKHPPFTSVYPFIKSLLEDENNIVLGHSIMNDIKYLNLETKRFKLPSFRLSFSDSQLLYMCHVNDFSRQFGLEHIAGALGVDFVPHRAADDAYATMRIVEAMCREKGCGYKQLAALYGVTDGRIKNYNIIAPTSSGVKQYHKKINEEKLKRAAKRTAFFNFVSRRKCKKNGGFYGKIFTFSREIEENTELAKTLVVKIYENGGRYSQHVSQSDYYITDGADSSQRTQNALKRENLTVTDTVGLEEMLNGAAR